MFSRLFGAAQAHSQYPDGYISIGEATPEARPPRPLSLTTMGIVGALIVSALLLLHQPTKTLHVQDKAKDMHAQKRALEHGKYIVIIRHGEKPKDLSLNSLNALGWERSHWLADWVIQTLPRFTEGIPITRLITAIPWPNGMHVRPIQTITPLSIKSGLAIQPCRDARAAYRRAVEEAEHQNGTVLVCWQHEDVQEMMKYFGFEVPFWSDDEYNRFYVINWRNRTFVEYREPFQPENF